ncbi:alpha/beta hydrolase-fold protein [Gordonia sp. PKS22-38]|uniref:Alpha/beta hydrolase-fold protein n=1 Tax=Gordonia prachuapensis TaxID=3115651 RepID=A0ABU7MYD1_9ACTN|nr:alpha/beta hydrolase-fold protein [Gordonia sp. PKS22-38]
MAVDPTTLRTGCSYTNNSERDRNIQTCRVWSESMQSMVVVKVRPSSQQPGQQEQAVYFLGGVGGGDEADSIASQYSEQYTLVQVVDGSNAWSSNWQALPVDADGNTLPNRSGGVYDPQWETFIGEELPAYLEQDFSVEQTGNAIVGLSLGGGQAVNLALKYPEVFKVAHSISGYYQTDSVFGYLLIPYILSNRNGIANGLDGMWGNPFAPGNQWAANDVTRHIIEARDNDQIIVISAGTGLLTGRDEFDELIGLGGIGEVVFGSLLETMSFASTLALNGVAIVFDLPVRFNYSHGAHTWQHWNANAEEEADMVQDALEEYERPEPATTSAAVEKVAVTSAPSVEPSPSVAPTPSAVPSTSVVPSVVPSTGRDFPSTGRQIPSSGRDIPSSGSQIPSTEPSIPSTVPSGSSTVPTSAPAESTDEPTSAPETSDVPEPESSSSSAGSEGESGSVPEVASPSED